MAGPTQLKSQKMLLTRYTNILNQLVAKLMDQIRLEQSLKVLSEMGVELNISINLVADTLRDFTEVVDRIEGPITNEQEDQINDYISKTHATLEEARQLNTQIEVKKTSLGLHIPRSESRPAEIPCAKVELPSIPIPIFTGKIGAFENFWALFHANVHSQNLSNLQKFNYLLRSLKGEARDVIKRYPITEENYEAVIKALHSKYGDKSKLIYDLQVRLERAKAKSSSIEEQRRLLDYLISITTQLEFKDVNLNGSFIAQKIISKFHSDLQRKVLRLRMGFDQNEEDWSLRNVLADLDNVITAEEKITEMLRSNEELQGKHRQSRPFSYMGSKTEGNSTGQPLSCIYCDLTNHSSGNCRKISTIKERTDFLLRTKRCLNCARTNHLLKDCISRGCNVCEGKKHHFSICPKGQDVRTIENVTPYRKPTPNASIPSAKRGTKDPKKPIHRQNLATTASYTETPVVDEGETSALYVTNQKDEKCCTNILLLTGLATVQNPITGQRKDVEFLLDTGADRSFIDRQLADELNLKTHNMVDLAVYTFGSKNPQRKTYETASLEIRDLQGNTHQILVYKTDVITEKAKQVRLTSQDIDYLRRENIVLSRARATLVNPQLLIGCDQLWPLLHTSNPQHILPSGLFAIPSKLGYLLSGRQGHSAAMMNHIDNSMTAAVGTLEVDEVDRWDQYWSLDSAGIEEFTGAKYAEKLAINAKVQKFFNDTIEKREDGYYVRLPFKDNKAELPTNKTLAYRRLLSVLNSLRAKPELLQQYHGIFQDQLEKGILEEISNPELINSELVHYLPHQPVITPLKQTTKLRIVYDASSHLKESPSLNEVIHQGPLILPNLYGMLLRFRTSHYVAISDVEKAFLQVRLNEKDRDVTRCLWVKDVNKEAKGDNIAIYRFTRVTFGINVSPFLLAATIRYHIEHEVKDVELASEISENLYVDNLILMANKRDEIMKKVIDAKSIFQDMNMNLREFLASDKAVLKNLPSAICSSKAEQKVLGILWNSENDTLSIKCEFTNTPKVTKRSIAKQIASIYDPLGWLVPLLVQLKRFQQKLWEQGYSWDQELPKALCDEWVKAREEANGFQRTFQREVSTRQSNINIAVFADASENAIAACAYAFNSGNVTLLMAKSKLPSIRTKTTIPKLEMNAITMGARLARSVCEALRKTASAIKFVFIFTDSQIVLNWVNKSPDKRDLGVLVRNRIKEIREISSSLLGEGIQMFFGYVPTKLNPADAGTRGLSKVQLDGSDWWQGPPFLQQPISSWTGPLIQVADLTASEENPLPSKATFNFLTVHVEDDRDKQFPLHRYSSLKKGSRIMGWILRFLGKLLKCLPNPTSERILIKIPELRQESKRTGPLNGLEIRNARQAIIRNHQLSVLSPEYIKSMSRTLKLFEDNDGLWRARGRLGNSSMSDHAKFPIFIAPKTELASKIISEAHGTYHQGVAHIMASVREKYWIPKLRQQARQVTSQCVKCRRFNASPFRYPDTPDLPSQRVQETRPFENIGLDFFDLPPVKESEELSKTYGCIFTCAVTRLVHLEVLRSMSTEAFLNSLRRFFSRRGIPASITCDNAPTFLLSAEILRSASSETAVAHFLANNAIEWKHITPYAPWQGGFYERLIKSIKYTLYKAIGRAQLSFDSLVTILTEVEATINSRPLTYQESEYEEFCSLRPIDFIQNRINLTFPFENIETNSSDPDYLPTNEQFSDLREKMQQDPLKMITEETQTDDVPLVPMDVEVIQEDVDNVEREGEQARIMDNAEYMEAIQEDAEEVELQENEQIMKDIALLEQDLALVQRRLEELSKERLCRPRTYEIGVDRDEEKMMPCAFCHVPGHHYSDSCRELPLAAAREESLEKQKRCTMCLEVECEKDRSCPKYKKRCHYCKITGHASAICPLPERSLKIAEERIRLMQTAEDIMEQLEALRNSL